MIACSVVLDGMPSSCSLSYSLLPPAKVTRALIRARSVCITVHWIALSEETGCSRSLVLQAVKPQNCSIA